MTDPNAFWRLKGIVAYHPSFGASYHPDRPNTYRADVQRLQVAIECLDGKTTADSALATHEMVLEGEPTTDLPRLERARIDRHITGAMSALLQASPRPRIAHAPAFTSEAPKRSLWQRLRGIQPPVSQYFGSPWMPHDADWPEYEGAPMQFVMQLDLSKLPQHDDESAKLPLPKSGYLTLFLDGTDYDEDGADSHVVIYPDDVRGAHRRRPHTDQPIPPRYIKAWRPMVDHAHDEDLDEETPFTDLLEITTSMSVGQVLTTAGHQETEKEVITMNLPYERHCFECDKLGGWPRWEQGPEWPEDSNGERMVCIYQLAADGGMLLGGACLDDISDIDHPVVGRGQIFYSPNTGELRYVWACD